MNKPFTVVSLFDIHCPKTDWPTLKAILQYIGENPPDVLLLGGDNLDCEAISHHNKAKPLYRERGAMLRDLETFRTRVLEPIEARLRPDTKRVWLTGNHEDWAAQLVESSPELDGLLDFPAYLGLRGRPEWTVKEQGGHWKHGHLKYLHGDVLTGGQAAPGKALNTFVESVVFGHFHAFASATKILPGSNRYKWQAWGMGCVGKLDAKYLRNRPTGWMNGFGITEFYGTGGHFCHYPVTVFNGRFAYGGKTYDGRQKAPAVAAVDSRKSVRRPGRR